MGRLSWIIRVGTIYSHMHPYIKEIGDLTYTQEEKNKVKMEAETGMLLNGPEIWAGRLGRDR